MAVPDNAASRATNATAMAGEGRLARNLRIVGLLGGLRAQRRGCDARPWVKMILRDDWSRSTPGRAK